MARLAASARAPSRCSRARCLQEDDWDELEILKGMVPPPPPPRARAFVAKKSAFALRLSCRCTVTAVLHEVKKKQNYTVLKKSTIRKESSLTSDVRRTKEIINPVYSTYIPSL